MLCYIVWTRYISVVAAPAKEGSSCTMLISPGLPARLFERLKLRYGDLYWRSGICTYSTKLYPPTLYSVTMACCNTTKKECDRYASQPLSIMSFYAYEPLMTRMYSFKVSGWAQKAKMTLWWIKAKMHNCFLCATVVRVTAAKDVTRDLIIIRTVCQDDEKCWMIRRARWRAID